MIHFPENQVSVKTQSNVTVKSQDCGGNLGLDQNCNFGCKVGFHWKSNVNKSLDFNGNFSFNKFRVPTETGRSRKLSVQMQILALNRTKVLLNIKEQQ